MAFLFSFDCDSPDQGSAKSRTGPAVGDDQRQRVLVLRADVQDVDAEAVDGGLVLAPVVAVTPIIDQRLDLWRVGRPGSSRRLSPRPASGSGRCGG